MGGSGKYCVVLLAGLGEAETLVSRVLAGGDVEFVEVFVLVEGVNGDVLPEGGGSDYQYVLHGWVRTLRKQGSSGLAQKSSSSSGIAWYFFRTGLSWMSG